MARRSDHSREEIHEMALQAAIRIVEEEGIAAVTARRVASEIGYTVGTLYLVFDNLDGLIAEVNGTTLHDLQRYLVAQVDHQTHPAQQLRSLCQSYFTYARDHRSRWQLLFDRTTEDPAELPSWYRERVRQSFILVETVLAGVMVEADNAEISQAARALWGSVHGISQLALTGRLDIAEAGEAEKLIDYIVAHILNSAAESQ